MRVTSSSTPETNRSKYTIRDNTDALSKVLYDDTSNDNTPKSVTVLRSHSLRDSTPKYMSGTASSSARRRSIKDSFSPAVEKPVISATGEKRRQSYTSTAGIFITNRRSSDTAKITLPIKSSEKDGKSNDSYVSSVVNRKNSQSDDKEPPAPPIRRSSIVDSFATTEQRRASFEERRAKGQIFTKEDGIALAKANLKPEVNKYEEIKDVDQLQQMVSCLNFVSMCHELSADLLGTFWITLSDP